MAASDAFRSAHRGEHPAVRQYGPAVAFRLGGAGPRACIGIDSGRFFKGTGCPKKRDHLTLGGRGVSATQHRRAQVLFRLAVEGQEGQQVAPRVVVAVEER